MEVNKIKIVVFCHAIKNIEIAHAKTLFSKNG